MFLQLSTVAISKDIRLGYFFILSLSSIIIILALRNTTASAASTVRLVDSTVQSSKSIRTRSRYYLIPTTPHPPFLVDRLSKKKKKRVSRCQPVSSFQQNRKRSSDHNLRNFLSPFLYSPSTCNTSLPYLHLLPLLFWVHIFPWKACIIRLFPYYQL